MAVTGAADRAPERVALLVYVDALVPVHGQSGLDLLPEGFGAGVRGAADEHGHGWVTIPDAVLPPEGLIPDDVRDRYVARLRDQPVATFTEPIHLTNAVARVRRAFIRCTGYELDVGGDPIEPMAARARAEGWPYLELAAPHDPHLFDPIAMAAVLNELAATAVSDRDPAQSGCARDQHHGRRRARTGWRGSDAAVSAHPPTRPISGPRLRPADRPVARRVEVVRA